MKNIFAAFVFLLASLAGPAQTGQALAATGDAHTLFAVLRPDSNGDWYIQDDSSHKRHGIDTYIEQTSSYIRIFTCCVASFTKAGTIQITTDDGFNVRVSAHSNLGYNNATIQIYVDGSLIDPADIWTELGGYTGNGNLWLTLQMVE